MTRIAMTPLEDISVSGELEERLERSRAHLVRLDSEDLRRELVEPDAAWHWGADYMGRWIGTMAVLGAQTGDLAHVSAMAHELIGHQRADGSFGSFGEDHDFQEWFGMGRGLVGLLDYHRVTADPDALTAARRLGDFYVEHYPEAAGVQVECYATALDGLVRLAAVTGDDRYLTVARRAADSSTPVQRLWASNEFGYRGLRVPVAGAVHCHLLAGRGLLDLFERTHDGRYQDAVDALYDHITSEALSVNGSVGEFLMGAEESETCADADWLRLNLQLWRATGEDRYLEMAEHVLLNALFFDQTDTGAFTYRRGVQGRPGASFDACCSSHGPRAMVEALQNAFAGRPESLSVNLFLDARGRLLVDDAYVHIETATWQDVEENTAGLRLTMGVGADRTFPVQIRVPQWAGSAHLQVNGSSAAQADSPGTVAVTRHWSAGDVIEVHFPTPVRVVRGRTIGRHVTDDRAVAIFHGPRLFCLTERLNPEHRLDLLRLTLPGSEPEASVAVVAADRLEVPGIGPDGELMTLALWPLAHTGGSPNGTGRTHPTKANYFKTWLPTIGSQLRPDM